MCWAGTEYTTLFLYPHRCARRNRPLHEALCAWLDEPAMAAEFFAPPSDTTNADGLRFAMHEVLVLERFAQVPKCVKRVVADYAARALCSFV